MTATAFPGKKGAVFTLRPEGKKGSWTENLPKVKLLNPYWNYNWSASILDAQPEEVEFVPMIWGGAKSMEAMQERIDEHIIPQIEKGTCKRILGFNEPDKSEQSNLPVEKCIEFWPLLEKLDIPLVSPACANPLGCELAEASCQGVKGPWMREFMAKANELELRVDYVGVHWYGGANSNAFKKRMKEVYDTYNERPLVITEFAVADWTVVKKSPEDNKFKPWQVLKFMKEVIPWIEEQDWIVAYSWFNFGITCPQGTCSAMFDDEGGLTPCGEYYASVTTENPSGDQSITMQ